MLNPQRQVVKRRYLKQRLQEEKQILQFSRYQHGFTFQIDSSVLRCLPLNVYCDTYSVQIVIIYTWQNIWSSVLFILWLCILWSKSQVYLWDTFKRFLLTNLRLNALPWLYWDCIFCVQSNPFFLILVHVKTLSLADHGGFYCEADTENMRHLSLKLRLTAFCLFTIALCTASYWHFQCF